MLSSCSGTTMCFKRTFTKTTSYWHSSLWPGWTGRAAFAPGYTRAALALEYARAAFAPGNACAALALEYARAAFAPGYARSAFCLEYARSAFCSGYARVAFGVRCAN